MATGTYDVPGNVVRNRAREGSRPRAQSLLAAAFPNPAKRNTATKPRLGGN